MICVGTTSWQYRWELRCAKIQKRRGRNCEKQHHQQWSLHSSLEVPARPPNSPHNCPLPSQRIEMIGRFCSFTAPIGFRSQRKWDVIDLVAQEMGSDTTARRGGTPPYASSFRLPRSKKLTFALPAGKAFEFRNQKSHSGRKFSTLIRAERISKERRSGRSSEYERGTENEDGGGGGLDDTSMWDSNAEGIRRGRFRKKANVSSEEPLGDRTQKQQEFEYDGEVRSSRSKTQKKQEWEFDEPRTRSERDEWDYDAEARTSRSQKVQAEDSPWWQSSEDNYAYESDGETREASTSFRDMFSWMNADVKDAFVFIRWGLPAAVLLVPWLMGNPMMLLLGLSFIPAGNKFIGPIANSIFRTVMAGASPPKPRRRRKQNTGSPSSSSRRSQQAQRPSSYYEREAPAASNSSVIDPPEADLFTAVSTTIFGDPNVDDVPRKPPRLGRSNGSGSGTTKRLGGWEDLEEDRARARSERWPMDRRSSRSEKKIVKREERNIFVRLILALFPFLRYWGGLM